jgi:hypothetical protein
MGNTTIRNQPRRNYVIQIYINPDHKKKLDEDLEIIRKSVGLASQSETIRYCLAAGINKLKTSL